MNKPSKLSDHLDIDSLINWVPSSFTNRYFLGLYLWQYVAMLVWLLLASISYQVIRLITQNIVNHLSRRWQYTSKLEVASPLSIILVIQLAIITIPIIQLPHTLECCLILLSKGFAACLFIFVCYRLVDLLTFYIHKRKRYGQNKVLVVLLPLLNNTAKVLVVIIGAISIMNIFHLDTKALLTGFSISSLGFALASQDTIKNLFGSLMILLDKPFSIGDTIVSGNVEGNVEEIGLRSTRLRTAQESILYVPNAKLADAHIDNYGLRRYRRFFTRLGIRYDNPPILIDTFLEKLREIAHKHPYVVPDKCFIYLNDLKAAGLEIIFQVYFDVTQYRDELQGRHELLMNIMKLAEELRIRFA